MSDEIQGRKEEFTFYDEVTEFSGDDVIWFLNQLATPQVPHRPKLVVTRWQAELFAKMLGVNLTHDDFVVIETCGVQST